MYTEHELQTNIGEHDNNEVDDSPGASHPHRTCTRLHVIGGVDSKPATCAQSDVFLTT